MISGESIKAAAVNMPLELAIGVGNQLCLSLERHGHSSGRSIEICNQDMPEEWTIWWESTLSAQEADWYADDKDRVEASAIALAVILVERLTGYRVKARSNIGTRIDYYLAPKSDTVVLEDTYILDEVEAEGTEMVPFLEVTGIDKENKSNTILGRRQSKIKNLDKQGGPGAGNHLTFIAISEMSRPAFDLFLS